MNMCLFYYQKKIAITQKSLPWLTLSKSFFMWICVRLLWLSTNSGTGSRSQRAKTKESHPTRDSLELEVSQG